MPKRPTQIRAAMPTRRLTKLPVAHNSTPGLARPLDNAESGTILFSMRTTADFVQKAKADLKATGLPALTRGVKGRADNDPFQYYKLALHLARQNAAPPEVITELSAHASKALADLRTAGTEISY